MKAYYYTNLVDGDIVEITKGFGTSIKLRGPKQQQSPNGICVPRVRCCFGARGPQLPIGL